MRSWSALAVVVMAVVTTMAIRMKPAMASPSDDVNLDAPGAVRANAPPVRDVLEAAYRAAGLHRDVGRGFVRRARLAGLVPWLSVRTARDTSWRELEPDVGRSMTLEVRATWRLDRLVFEPRELQVASLDAARRRERRRLARQVIRVYFAWRDAPDPTDAEEAAAELDALTDGWFTKIVENHGRTSESRTSGPGHREMP